MINEDKLRELVQRLEVLLRRNPSTPGKALELIEGIGRELRSNSTRNDHAAFRVIQSENDKSDIEFETTDDARRYCKDLISSDGLSLALILSSNVIEKSVETVLWVAARSAKGFAEREVKFRTPFPASVNKAILVQELLLKSELLPSAESGMIPSEESVRKAKSRIKQEIVRELRGIGVKLGSSCSSLKDLLAQKRALIMVRRPYWIARQSHL